MEGHDLPAKDGAGAARLVRALGQHRYVAARLHLVHVFAVDAAVGSDLTDAKAWAAGVLASKDIDPGSRDERLYRPCTEGELACVLASFWAPTDDPARGAAHARLSEHLSGVDVTHPSAVPFDESKEEDIFPLLVDAGWELLPLAQLDAERHKGVIQAFGEPILFEAAVFDEDCRDDKSPYLQELSAMGAAELLHGTDDDGMLVAPFTVWTSGPEAYHDYLLRGVLRAAKIQGA